MPRLSKIGAAALAAFGWTSGVSAVSASYLVVAGGGGGGRLRGGGGGAGGLRTGTLSLNPALSYTVTVGAGGAGSTVTTAKGSNGTDSVFSTITSTGGGGGGSAIATASSPILSGASGGSGGGGASDAVTGATGGSGGAGNTPSTSPSQGNNGGASSTTTNFGGGGGGGAGGAGSAGGTSTGGAGGAGTASSISGSSVTYAGGGGGGIQNTGGAGGSGGGGTGGSGAGAGGNGTANLGGGGGGDGNAGVNGGTGGSGIVIISYAGAQQFGGGVVTSVGGNTIHTFTTSGTLVPVTPLSASYLVVAGGGGGGQYTGSGGGGAGGFRTSSAVLDTNSIYTVTVGAGGAGGVSGSQSANGSDSAFSSTTSTGGGGGGGYTGSFYNGKNGGSGGGGNYSGAATNGTGNTPSTSPSQGNNGGAGGVGNDSGGGGGGATAAGTAGAAAGGNGGAGTASSISGSSVTYAGGGGGAKYPSGTAGTGGAGGGGNGGVNAAGTAGTANTGGGGGGSGSSSTAVAGGAGGSGIVIISYPGSTQQMAGGTVTITGGNVIHTFTSSGYLAPLKLVNNSLRFRKSATAYLNRTFGTPTSLTTWTWSGWVKRGELGTTQYIFHTQNPGNTVSWETFFQTDNTLIVRNYGGSSYTANYVTTQVFRDPAAWYHMVVTWDTTNATSTDRVRIYINGSRVTAFTTSTAPSSSATSVWNTATYVHAIGAANGGSALDGYMTEVNFIDGQSLTPNSFGTFNSYGVWQPITYGGSYGTNGFYLPFKTNASSYVGSFNGSNQYLSIASNSVFNQSGDFTIEYYAYLNANTNYQVIVGRGTGFITIQHSSDANAMIRLVRYGQATIATGGNVTAGKWNHFAIVRSGSTVTGYLNGIAVVSGTDSTSTATGNALAIGQNSDGTNYFAGQISNVRYTNTAVYTSNFTPSTSALTAVSGTQLLTLQNSSIVDNSTNALSITNNNSVTTGQTYPFAYTIFNDQGPAGNNWTPNNVSGVFGSTLDYMTDVPTLTSATAANYAVLNPLSTLFTVTVGNLDFTYTNSTSGVWYLKGTLAVSSDKYYWEVTPTNVGGGPNISIGIILSTNTQTNTTTTNLVTDGYVYHCDGNKYSGAGGTTGVAYGATYTNNDVIGVALDLTAGTLVFYKNNVSQGTAFTGLTSSYMLLICNHLGGTSRTVAGSVNAGQRPFTYTPPTGFVALNTYNL